MCDVVEILLGREHEHDLIAHEISHGLRSSSISSCSRCAAAALPASPAGRQSRIVLKSAAPKLTPAPRPLSFGTDRVTDVLTARTAVSTVSAASTALSVIRS